MKDPFKELLAKPEYDGMMDQVDVRNKLKELLDKKGSASLEEALMAIKDDMNENDAEGYELDESEVLDILRKSMMKPSLADEADMANCDNKDLMTPERQRFMRMMMKANGGR